MHLGENQTENVFGYAGCIYTKQKKHEILMARNAETGQ